MKPVTFDLAPADAVPIKAQSVHNAHRQKLRIRDFCFCPLKLVRFVGFDRLVNRVVRFVRHPAFAVEHGAAQDLLVIRTPDGRDVRVPFVVALVPAVTADRVTIDPPGGLFDGEEA